MTKILRVIGSILCIVGAGLLLTASIAGMSSGGLTPIIFAILSLIGGIILMMDKLPGGIIALASAIIYLSYFLIIIPDIEIIFTFSAIFGFWAPICIVIGALLGIIVGPES